MNSAPRIPSVGELLWPTLRAVREIGDSGTIEEIVEKAIELEGFTEEQQAVLHGDGPRTKIEYHLAWARSYLKGMGALDNSERGVWSTTEAGRSMTPEDVVSRHAAYVSSLREARKAKQLARAEQDDELEEESARRDWKERLLEVLFEVPPDGFERLARRLLREFWGWGPIWGPKCGRRWKLAVGTGWSQVPNSACWFSRSVLGSRNVG